MCELGNSVINRIYEARRDEITIKKPLPSSPRYVETTGDSRVWLVSNYTKSSGTEVTSDVFLMLWKVFKH